MAEYTLSAKVTADTSDFESGMEQSRDALGRFQSKCKESSDQSSKSTSGFATAASNAWGALKTNASQLGGAIKSVGGTAIATIAGIAVQGGFDRALNIDTARQKLYGFSQDWGTVDSVMKSAQASVKGTQYGLGDAASAATTLSAAGVAAGDDMTSSLKSIANASAASGRSFGEMGTIYGKVAATGHLTGETLQSLLDSGIPVLSILSKALGVSTDDVRQMVSDGTISFQTFSDAMQSGLGASAEASANTFTGSAANVRAALSRMVEPMATPVIQTLTGFFKQLAPAIDQVTSNLGPVVTALAPAIAGFAAFAGGSAISGLITKVPMLSGMLGPLSGVFSAMSGPIGVAVAAFVGLVAVCPGLQSALGNLMSSVGNLANSIGAVLGPPIQVAIGLFGQFVQSVGGGLAEGFQAASDAINGFVSGGGVQQVVGFFDQIGASVQVVAGYFGSIFGPAITTLQTGLSALATNIGGIVQPAIDSFNAAWVQVSSTVTAIWSQITTVLQPAIQQLQPVLTVIVSVLSGMIGPALQMVASILTGVFGAAFTIVGGVVSGAMQAIAGVIEFVVGTIQGVIGVFVGIFTGDWSMASDGASAAMTGMSDVVTGIMNAVSGTIGGIVQGISDTIGAVFNGIIGIASGAFQGAANAISSIMGDASNTVSGALDNIAGFFRGLHIEWPHINLPHFTVSGELNLDPAHLSVPSIGVDWYAAGGVFTSPSIIGVGDSRSPEIVTPEDKMSGVFSDVLDGFSGGRKVTQNFTQNIDAGDDDPYVVAAIMNRNAMSLAMGV
ncbi:MAG: tape measure protein [Atopobium sp.]|nr:tape measure protein [Atopobium sp.]